MKKLILPLFALFFSVSLFAQEQIPSVTTATAGKLTVKWALSSPGANSYLAVYITNSSNQLVNTLSYQFASSSRDSQLSTFWSLIGSSYNVTNFKFVGTPDGSTGATFNGAIAQKTVYWGNSATMATAVAALADGNYNLIFELVRENNLISKYTVVFAKGPTTSTPTIPTMSYFNSVSASWVPANTAVQDVELQKMYSLYPSQAVSSIYVTGLDIEGIDICTLSAKIISHSNEQKVNISSLPKGMYMAVIYTKAGMVVKKFQKI